MPGRSAKPPCFIQGITALPTAFTVKCTSSAIARHALAGIRREFRHAELAWMKGTGRRPELIRSAGVHGTALGDISVIVSMSS
jgi:hypothetical protein